MPKPALICPRQDTAPFDGQPNTLFAKVWWLFFHNLTSALKSLVDALGSLTLPVSVPNGGTGDATLAAHGVLLGEGALAVVASAAGNAGQPFLSGGASADGAFGQLENLTAIASGLPQTIPFAIGNVAGATITLDKTGTYLVLAFATMNGDNTTGQTTVKMNYNGSDQTQTIDSFVTSAAGTFLQTGAAHWLIANSGSKIAKLRSVKAANAGTALLNEARITAIFLG